MADHVLESAAVSGRSRSAAHRTLPFGTVLTVQKGGRSVQVTVTDRGSFTGAFLDLSPAAASALGYGMSASEGKADLVLAPIDVAF